MRLGIVGSEQAKFTEITEVVARKLIDQLISRTNASTIVSGACHLGGIDIYARDAALTHKLRMLEFKPKKFSWEEGFKPRNIEIAENSDEVYCITVTQLPNSYDGMKFPLCYHCKTSSHVKSGGCWTVRYAKNLGKLVGIYAITPEGNVTIEL